MHRAIRIATGMGLLLLAAAVIAAPPPGYQPPMDDGSRSIDNETYIDAGNILMFVTNHANFGQDIDNVFGYYAGTFYPFTTIEDIESGLNGNCLLYAAGLWLGGLVDGQVRVALAEYDDEYVPGPMAGGGPQPDDPSFKVYKLYSDSLASNPNADYLNWPVDQGAPVDAMGSPLMRGNQMLWAVYNDADPAQHTNDAGYTDPLGVEVRQTTWAFDNDGPAGDVIFISYQLFNNGPNTVTDMYVSLWADPDLGYPSDDLVGCDTLDNLFFCYNGDNDDAGHYGSAPPAVGFKILAGPLVASVDDTADFDGTPVPGYKNLPMTSFQKYINGTDPTDPIQSYNYMRGLNADGSPLPNGTNYAVPGDPVTGVGDIDSGPSDRRMMGTCGPLTLTPGDSQYVLIKMAVGQGSDRLSSVTDLKATLNSPEPGTPILKAMVEPQPVNIVMLNAIEPIEAVMTFGYDAAGPVGELFEYGNLSVNGLPAIDSMKVLSGYPGFNGPVARFFFPLSDLLMPYVPLFDSVVHAYSVSGTYAGTDPFSFNSSVTIHGHRSGDLNLDGVVDISDLIFMVDYFFVGGPAPEDLLSADLDYNGSVDISDLLVLIEYMFETD